MVRVGVVDYQMGNLHSVTKALQRQGADVFLSDSKDKLRSADVLLLPGVGAFGAAMRGLAKAGLENFLRRWVLEDRRPFLGFCLGLQVLFESSEESPGVPGLGILKGTVVRFQERDFKRGAYRVPHMGWNTLDVKAAGKPFFKRVAPRDSVYFVHTFYPKPADNRVVAATTDYGKPFCAAAATERLFATQFHPEKSGVVGQHIIGSALRALATEAAAC
jgi:glutamine amidotransferase